MIIATCERCNQTREVTRIRKETKYCRLCAEINKREKLNVDNLEMRMGISNGRPMAEYLRVCECGDEKWVRYRPSIGTKCVKCSGKELGKNLGKHNVKEEKEKIRYRYECPDCGDVRFLSKSHKHSKSMRCGHCARVKVGNIKPGKKPKKEPAKKEKAIRRPKMRYFRICPECGNTKKVPQSNAGLYDCRPCTLKKKRELSIASPKVYKKQISKDAIDRAKEINKQHREREASKVKKKKIVQRKTDEEMMNEFLSKNEIKKYDSNYPVGMHDQQMKENEIFTGETL